MELISFLALKFLQFSLLIIISSCSSISGDAVDLSALLSFKNSITGDPHGALASWEINHTFNLCQWRGVTCGGGAASQQDRGRVIGLDLDSLRLVGSISPSIANLTYLQRLHLGDNQLHGHIPPELSRLSHLQYLNLSHNSIDGQIPSNLSYCKDLQVINLNYNMRVGEIPAELGSLFGLTQLILYNNNLTGVIPPSLGNISSLRMLWLAENYLEGTIPASIGTIPGLQSFLVAQNFLHGTIPSSLYNCSTLLDFNVGNNQLFGTIPPDIGNKLPNLQELFMFGNQFQGSFPLSLANASGLETIVLDDNILTGLIPSNLGTLKNLSWLVLSTNKLENNDLSFITSLTNCTSLLYLELYRNKLRGVLPSSIANFSSTLNWLTIGDNQISGSIPPAIGNLVGLNALFMEENLLTGVIPPSIGRLQGLQNLWLFDNKLSGEIPASIGNLTQLTELYFEVNQLHGTIPSRLGNLQALNSFNLSYNDLSGEIPREILNLSSVDWYFDLAYNSLTGQLPLEVGSMKNVRQLNVSNNRLSGIIPSTLGECVGLEYLYMQNNGFEGTIPRSLINLRGIQEIDLSKNKLAGQIPEYFQDFKSAQYLNLSYNNLEGEVPTAGIFANMSASSIVGNDNLCGGTPNLQLPSCSIQHSKKKSFLVKILLPSVLGFIVLISLSSLILVRCRSRSSRSETSTLVAIDHQHLRLSYGDLYKATAGFSLSNLIGSGSFGTVYKGNLEGNGEDIAVKVLNLQEKGASKSFMAECEVLRNIRHRNLLKVITSCSSTDFDGNEFKALVYEIMPKGSLDEWLHPQAHPQGKTRNLNFTQRLNIAIDVASALDYLHHHGQTPMVHCDLKPSNVLLDDDMGAHVGDFGLARFLAMDADNSSQISTISQGVKGSIGYIAPEYGIGGKISVEGDVYSYGVVLLEMLTGLKPTNDMFKDVLNLLEYVKVSFPEKVKDIVYPNWQLEEEDIEGNIETWKEADELVLDELLVSLFRIGIKCSEEDPRLRMKMTDVVRALDQARQLLCKKRCIEVTRLV